MIQQDLRTCDAFRDTFNVIEYMKLDGVKVSNDLVTTINIVKRWVLENEDTYELDSTKVSNLVTAAHLMKRG